MKEIKHSFPESLREPSFLHFLPSFLLLDDANRHAMRGSLQYGEVLHRALGRFFLVDITSRILPLEIGPNGLVVAQDDRGRIENEIWNDPNAE